MGPSPVQLRSQRRRIGSPPRTEAEQLVVRDLSADRNLFHNRNTSSVTAGAKFPK